MSKSDEENITSLGKKRFDANSGFNLKSDIIQDGYKIIRSLMCLKFHSDAFDSQIVNLKNLGLWDLEQDKPAERDFGDNFFDLHTLLWFPDESKWSFILENSKSPDILKIIEHAFVSLSIANVKRLKSLSILPVFYPLPEHRIGGLPYIIENIPETLEWELNLPSYKLLKLSEAAFGISRELNKFPTFWFDFEFEEFFEKNKDFFLTHFYAEIGKGLSYGYEIGIEEIYNSAEVAVQKNHWKEPLHTLNKLSFAYSRYGNMCPIMDEISRQIAESYIETHQLIPGFKRKIPSHFTAESEIYAFRRRLDTDLKFM